MKRKESGLTLLTLVITIIVMLILAGIALRLSIGDNGIIGLTSNTVDLYTNASEQEQEGLNSFVDEFNQILNEGRPGGDDNTGEDITISDKPTITIDHWQSTGGVVAISTTSEYTTQYRIGRTGEWQTYTGQVPVDNGDTIYARYASNDGVSATVSQIVEDTKGPDVTIANVDVNGAEITISVSAVDHEMGMPTPPTYNYYIKPSTETYYESIGHNTTGQFTFTGLQGNTAYDIRVSTTDLAGNQGVATTNSQTGATVEIPELVTDGENQNIFFTLNPPGPTNGTVDVSIEVRPSLESPLYLEYSKDGATWERYTSPVEMTDNGKVYAKVTDGTEESNVVYIDVTNIDKDDPQAEAEITDTTSDSITVEVTPTNPNDPDNDDYTYDYYIKESGTGDDEYVKDNGDNNKDGTHTFEGLEQGKDYDIKVEITDPAGNKITITLPNATTGEIPAGNIEGNITITPSETDPTNKPVTITITGKYTAEYDIKYSITTNGTEGPAQDYTGPFQVSENCTIKAWYTDGTNAGDPATLEIANIDKEKPTIEAVPGSDVNKSNSKEVKVTVKDTGIAGLDTNQQLNYIWTKQSSGTVTEGLKSLSGTANGTSEINYTVQNDAGLTGTYYLYIQSIIDKAGNASDSYFFGPYEFDSSVPRPEFGPNGSDEYDKHYDVEVTFPDGDGDEVTDIEYDWTQGKDTEPTFPGTSVEPGEDGKVTIPSPDDATGDDWYLNVKVEDENGNEEIIQVGPFKIDNTSPEVTYPEGDYDTPKQEHSVTVDVKDPNSGLTPDSPKYVWVNGDEEPTEEQLKGGTTFTPGDEIKTPEDATGDNYHLWIYAEDEVGNITKEDIGPFNIDNHEPTVTIEPNGSDGSWSKDYQVKVDPTDGANEAGIKEDTLKYQWTQSSTPPDADSFESGEHTGTFKPVDNISSPEGVTGDDWYLWIYVEDNAGNSSIIGSENPYLIDNTNPELNPEVVGSPSSNTITIKANATDQDSGINNGSYKYYIKETESGSYGEPVGGGDTQSFPNLKADTSYTIKIEVTDNAGNTTSKEITVSTGTVAGGDSVIEHSIQPQGWTNQSVQITLNLAEGYDGYKIQYQLQDGGWQDYSNAITVDTNQTIKVRPLDESNNPGTESTIEITTIDKGVPTLTAEPSSTADAVKTQTIKVTATDANNGDTNIAGFTAGSTIRYEWSNSDQTEPSYTETATSGNIANAQTAEFSIQTPASQTGTYYLWIQAGSIADQAGNQNVVTHFGPYTIDNTAPEITFEETDNTTYKKEHSVTVNAGDATVKKYVWTQNNTQAPSEGEFTNTFESGEPITKNTGSGDWYLWIYVEDSLGNKTTQCSEVFKFDNTAPEVTFGTNGNSTPQKTHTSTITIGNDGYSQIDNSSLKYLWTTKTEGVVEGDFPAENTFSNGGNITGSGLNGDNYYLWVMVKDEAGNVTIKRTDNTFNFDNTAPTATFNPTSIEEPAKEQSVNVSVTDTNLDESSLKFLVTETNTKPKAGEFVDTLSNNSAVPIEGGSGDRYLWILANDLAGNEVVIGPGGPYVLDNDGPEVSLTQTGTSSSITVKVEATDNLSGVASYDYTINQVGGSYTQTVTGQGASYTFSGLQAGTYTVTVTVKDNLGNATTKTTEQITTGTIPDAGAGALTISANPAAGEWTNTQVTITITNNVQEQTNLHVEYRIGTEGSYTAYTNSFQVSTNTTIYAKLVDDAGNEGNPTTLEIANIDKGLPQVTPTQTSDTNYTKTKTITVNATDTGDAESISGFNANQSLKYAWSTSNTTAPTSFKTVSGTNADGAQSISFSVPSDANLTGEYYLWVQAGSLTDKAGNGNQVAHFGPYYFDNTAPTLGGDGQITVTSTTSKSISISVPAIQDNSGTVSNPQYTYYIDKGSGYVQDGTATTEKTHTFEGLEDDTLYNIKVTFADNSGNVGEVTASDKTMLVPTLVAGSNVTFTLSTEEWTNKDITVEISTTEQGYQLQYSLDGTNYQNYTTAVTVSANGTIYARLWDNRDASGNFGGAGTKAITNIDKSLSDLGVIVKNDDPVEEDTKVDDSEGNPITIPEGFTPQKDPDSSDPYNPTVEDGVIVKDGSGNEFVWIPVGTINTDSGTKTINYDRYTYANWINGGTDEDTNSIKIQTSSDSSEYFAESLNQSEKTSAVNNHGFYLGRYEAGVSSGVRTESSGTSAKVEIKQGKDVYNYVTQSEARTLAENMATVEGYSGTTNLPSSYAWDTALKFLEQTGNTSYLTDSSQGNYYNTQYGGKTQEIGSALISTGETTAVNHLYDMGGNVYEWTTERYSNSEATKVSRGGFYGFTSTDEPVIGRFSSSNTRDQAVGFRVALFLGTVNDQVRYMDDLQVGDYVAYTPGSETASSYSLTSAESGYTSAQTVSRVDNLSWRVLSINDDGTVDLISSTPTFIYFTGALGYNNGVYLLNDISAKLYSNNSLGATARSLNIEDIEKGMNEAGLNYVHTYEGSVAYKETKTYTGLNAYYPNLYAQENDSGINGAEVKTDGIGQSDSYYTSPTTETSSQAEKIGLTVTQTFYNRSMSSNYYDNSTFYDLIHNVELPYWIASRYVNTDNGYAYFGIRFVIANDFYGNSLFYSSNNNSSGCVCLRPVVSLKSNIRLGSGDGSEGTPYQIAN